MPTIPIPLSAWEQAGIVVPFIVLVILLLRWFSKQQLSWQGFIKDRDKAWQEFLRDIREADCERHNKTDSILTKIAELLAAHDLYAHEIGAVIEAERRRKQKEREA